MIARTHHEPRLLREQAEVFLDDGDLDVRIEG